MDAFDKQLVYIKQLVGQPLVSMGRACDMAWINFGDRVPCDLRGEVNKYAIHLQCPWRMMDSAANEILFASYDIYLTKAGVEWELDFDWDIQGNNLYDESVKRWLDENVGITVNDLTLNRIGDLTVGFSGGFVLQTFSNSASDNERWRFFVQGIDTAHFVVSGKGIDFPVEL